MRHTKKILRSVLILGGVFALVAVTINPLTKTFTPAQASAHDEKDVVRLTAYIDGVYNSSRIIDICKNEYVGSYNKRATNYKKEPKDLIVIAKFKNVRKIIATQTYVPTQASLNSRTLTFNPFWPDRYFDDDRLESALDAFNLSCDNRENNQPTHNTGETLNFNFGPSNSDYRLENHIQDTGKEFSKQERGISYGWSKDHRDNVKYVSNDSLDYKAPHLGLQTYAEFLDSGRGVFWKVDLEPGVYLTNYILGGARVDSNANHSIKTNLNSGHTDGDRFCKPEGDGSPWCEKNGFVVVGRNRTVNVYKDPYYTTNNVKLNLIRFTKLNS